MLKRKILSAMLFMAWAALFLAASASPLFADMPAKNYYAAQIEPLKKVIQVFGDAEKKAFLKAVPTFTSSEPYPDSSFNAKTCIHCDENAFMSALTALITPSLEKGDVKKVQAFLETISKKQYVRGILRARNGGPFVTAFSVGAESPKKFTFTYTNKIQSPGAVSPSFTHTINL
ncbi:MAG: hypothetical protein RDV48_24395 [Candidatus Eremiobacteraeota bacterium]|nr:hypothetical protein [Candidatus Eremiobacteraeota bacterium]